MSVPLRPLLLALASAPACVALEPEPLIEPHVRTTDQLGAPSFEDQEPRLPEPSWVRVSTLLGAAIGDHELEPLGRIEDLWIERETGGIKTITIDLEDSPDRLYVPAGRVRWNRKEGPSLLNLFAADLERAVLHRRLEEQTRLFRTREVTRLEGRIMEVVEPEGLETGFVFLKVRQPNNHFHRVLLAPVEYAREAGFQLHVEDAVEIEAVETRDDKGRVWVAKSFTANGTPVSLRGDDGEPVWQVQAHPPELAELFQEPPADGRVRVQELLEGEVRDATERRARLSGLIVDDLAEVAGFVVVECPAGERLFPWKLLDADEAPWRVLTSLDVVEGSPALRAGQLGEAVFWSAVRAYYEARVVAAAGWPPAPAPPPAAEASGAPALPADPAPAPDAGAPPAP